MSSHPRRRCVDVQLSEDAAAELFSRLYQRSPRAAAAFLDSSDHARTSAPQRSRYSILAFALGEAAESVHLPSGAVEWLAEAWVPDRRAPQRGPSFQLGWVGFIGYENQGRFFRATHAVVVDHHAGTAELQSLGEDPQWEAAVREELTAVAAHTGTQTGTPSPTPSPWWALSAGKSAGPPQNSGTNRPPAQAETHLSGAHRPLTELSVRDGRQAYLAKIAAAQQQIAAGNSYEVCLTTAVTARFAGSPWQAYLRLRRKNRAPFTQYLHLPGAPVPSGTVPGASHPGTPAPEASVPEARDDVVLLSTSPERFAQISPSGTIRSEPIKGTRPRGADAHDDARLRADLASHPKDRAENVMIADLVRNDLSVFAVPGTLGTERLCAVETYPTVHQMVSTISARLAPGADRARALAAAFPPGSMTGAPKISTMNILRQLESGQRGPYSGAAGYFSTTGACDLAVLIRTAVLSRTPSGGHRHFDGHREPGRDWDFHLGLGGAITADSVPEEEWQEVIAKSRGVLGALGAEFPAR